MQHRITTPGPLHDDQGRLTETGYAVSLIKQYDRSRVKASRLRIKEWDYYCIVSDCHALALTIADNGYMYMDSISLLDFEANSQGTKSVILPPFGKRSLPPASGRGDIHVSGKGYEMTFENDGKRRRLYGHMEHFPTGKPEDETLLFDVTLTNPPRDSMVIATPFAGKPHAFYYNQKINCLRAEGKVAHGDREYLFAPAHSFAVLDWGRGVWTYDNTWYWGSASGLADGVPFGFNIGYGFGDTSAASENMLFYNGIAHKLSQVRFEIPMRDGKEDYLAPWKFTSDDGRFEMDFSPLMDRSAMIDLKLLCSDQHQVFGRFTGKAVLDDGREIQVRNLTGFAEKVHNKW
ncbi:MAG: DUF2804 domain-containing protein [Clostridia bacterium]|nr:DUF2804 domain-containing protein [Clostridia bacterium]